MTMRPLRPHPRLFSLLGAVAAMIVAAPALAQPPSSSPAPASPSKPAPAPAPESAKVSPSAATMAAAVRAAVAAHPAVAVAEREVEIARGGRLVARGAFDTKLRVGAGAAPVGPYDRLAASVAIDQRTSWWGASLTGGYRYGAGFPGYKGAKVTPSGGELFVGLVVPLLRDRAIDDARLGLLRGRIMVRIAEQRLRERRRQVAYAAARAWLAWRAAEARVAIAREQVKLAKDRMTALRSRVARGSAAAVVLVKGKRSLLARQAKLTLATQKRQQAALTLRFYLGAAPGRAAAALTDRAPLPSDAGALPVPSGLSPDLKRGTLVMGDLASRRPDLRAGRAALELSRARLGLLRQALLPKLKLKVEATRGVGAAVDWLPGQRAYPQASVLAKLRFSLPVQRRKAAGKLAMGEAKVAAAEAKLALATAKIRLRVQKAAVAWRAASALVDQRRQALAAARTLAAAERRKWQVGRSDLFVVLARERAVAKAALAALDARVRWHEARVGTWAEAAVLQQRLGVGPSAQPSRP